MVFEATTVDFAFSITTDRESEIVEILQLIISLAMIIWQFGQGLYAIKLFFTDVVGAIEMLYKLLVIGFKAFVFGLS